MSSVASEQAGKPAIVILAAGKGTRLRSSRPKVLHEIGGKPLLGHVIAAATEIVPAADVWVVVGHQAERVKAAVGATGVGFVDQPEQRGTGHALQCARAAIGGYRHLLVLSGDVPLIRPETIRQVLATHHDENAAMTILTAAPEDPTGYGRVLRRSPGSAEVEAIVEQKALKPEQLSLPEINSGIYAFATAPLLAHLDELTTHNAHGEYYLTDMAGLLAAGGHRVVATLAARAEEVLGANTLAELVALDRALRAETVARLMQQGVTVFRPDTCVIDAGVAVGQDTVIEPFVQLLGATRIGSDCRIRSYSVLEDVQLADGVLIRQHCVLADAEVAAGAKIGPFTHLRPGSVVGEQAHVGNFVEMKKARLGKGSKANHLTYLGDAEIGEGSNIGAGVITCNYDGLNKHTTVIGSGVFVGSDSTLVAPVTIADGAYVGASTCVTRDVPKDALAVGRARQVTKEGWAVGKRERLSAKQ